MIINKLIISGFGPFKDKEEIDFTEFNKEHIFLISGNTGSGKTSVFDAIMFCLYGEASGSIKKPEDFICTYKDDKTITYVELYFTVDNVDYHLKRQLKQRLYNPKTDSLSDKERPQEVELDFKDEHYDQITEVKDKINEILKIKKEQFKQIVMLPQGEFRRLLNADSKDRVEIFREIFNTHVYAEITEAFEEDYKKLKNQLDMDSNNISLRMQEMNADTTDPQEFINHLQDEVARLDKEIIGTNKAIETNQNDLKILSQEINSSRIRNNNIIKAKTLKQEYRDLLSEKDYYTALDNERNKLLKYKELVPLEENILAYKAKLDNAKEEIIRLEELIREKTSIYQRVSNDYKRLSSEDNSKYKEDYNNLVLTKDAMKELRQKTTELNGIDSELAGIKEHQEELNLTVRSLINEDKNLIIDSGRMLSLGEEYAKLSNKIEKITKLMNDVDNIGIELNNLRSNEETLEKNLKYFDSAFKNISRDYNDNIASFLASELEENLPCPVCGSKIHPELAVSKNSSTKEDYDKALDKLNMANQELNNARFEIKKLEEDYNKKDIELATELSNKTLFEYRNERDRLKQESETLTRNKERKDSIQVEVERLRVELDKTSLEYSNINEKKVSLNTSINNLARSIKSIYTEDNIDEFIDEARIKKENYESFIRETTKTYQDLGQDLAKLHQNYDNMNENIKMYLDEKNRLETKWNNLLFDNLISYNDYKNNKERVNEIPELETRINEYNQKVHTNSTMLKDLEVYLNFEVMDINELEDNYLKMDSSTKELIDERTKLISDRDLDKKYLETLTHYYEEYLALENKFSKEAIIAKTSKGDNELKLSFETYILTTYFDSLLVHANHLFLEMTDNRYKLVRKIDPTKGKAKTGLDLEVFDSRNNSRRDISSLSGGESFKASLALALAMSRTITSLSNKIKIDTIFIDEGFGSLDNESLDMAIETLMDYASDKVIGIISHVSELKERPFKRIEVIETNSGSYIKKKLS